MYYQGNGRITVIVRKEDGGSGGERGVRETDTEEIGDKQTTWRTALFGSERKSRIKRVILTNATHSIAAGKQITLLGLNYMFTGYGGMNGDEAHQDNVMRNVEIVEDYSNIASSIAMGALFGAWGGPIGVGVGMLLGAATSSVSTIFKYAGRGREYDYKMFKENNTIEYKRARANISLTTGRLR